VRDGPTDASIKSLLEDGETLLWQGRLGFNFASTPVFVFVFYALAGYAFWATWGSFSLEQFCPTAESVIKCGSFYMLVPPLLLLLAFSMSFDMLERIAILSGNSMGTVLLTDRRIIRVSDWPWRRTRTYNYHGNPERWSWGGVMRFGRYGSVILSPTDAIVVRGLIQSAQATP
jgi:hypothetical protein